MNPVGNQVNQLEPVGLMTQAKLVTAFRHLCLEVKPQDENIRFQIRSTQILGRHTLFFEPPSGISHPPFTIVLNCIIQYRTIVENS